VASLFSLLALSQTVYPNVCFPNQAPSWNRTACDSQATCCNQPFSVSGKGCCPLGPDAVCCSNNYTCCPKGTICQDAGSGYNVVTTCINATNSQPVRTGAQVCKSGPSQPYSTTLKNVIIIGDSVSIGYTPYVNNALATTAFVQHAPWDTSDGGAEETAYGVQCLDYFLHSPAGDVLKPDLIMFNWGLHDGPMSNDTVPGQNGNTTNYASELETIVQRLLQVSPVNKLLFGLTTPMLCNVNDDGCVMNLNNQAVTVMNKYKIATVDLHAAIVNYCGPVPQDSCFGETDCFCPHCVSQGYQWLAENVIAPAMKVLLN